MPEEAQYEVSHLCRESRDGKCFCIYYKNISILLHPCIFFYFENSVPCSIPAAECVNRILMLQLLL